jgi:HEAT repeat protein
VCAILFGSSAWCATAAESPDECNENAATLAVAGADNPDQGRHPELLIIWPSQLKGKSRADLLTMLKDERVAYRAAAIRELSKRKEPDIAPQLKELLQDQSGVVRFHAATALLDSGDQSAMPVMRELLISEPVTAKVRIAEVLARNGDDSGLLFATSSLASSSFTRRMAAVSALAASKNDDTAYAALETGLKDSNPYVRETAVNRLGKRPAKRSVDLLSTIVDDPDKDTRAMAVRALAATGQKEAAPLLLDAIADSEELVRFAAARSMNLLTGENKRTPFVLKPERAKEIEREWREWWEANKDKPLPSEKKK